MGITAAELSQWSQRHQLSLVAARPAPVCGTTDHTADPYFSNMFKWLGQALNISAELIICQEEYTAIDSGLKTGKLTTDGDMGNSDQRRR